MNNRFLHPAVDALRSSVRTSPRDLPAGLIDLPHNSGETFLGCAASDGDLDDLRALLERGADPNAPDLRGIPPIIHAAISRHAEHVILLLNAGAEVDATDANGRTALHYAALFGHIPMINILVKSGSDVLKCDIDGREVIDYARADHAGKQLPVVAELLQDSRDQALENEGKTNRKKAPLSLADLRGDTDFRRLDRLQRVESFGWEGVGYWVLFFVVVLSVGSGVYTENPYVGLAVLYATLLVHLWLSFILKPSRSSPPWAAGIPGASVREVNHILRASSRHLASLIDRSVEDREFPWKSEVRLWLLGFVSPLVAICLVGALGGIIAAGFYLLTYVPILGVIVGGAIAITALILSPRLLVAIMEKTYAYFAADILVQKIEARQSALSRHINRQRALREGGEFADGGVLYLRSFEFDGSFVSGGLDFELLLLHLFQGRAPLFSLNADPGSRGALNLETGDADWLALVQELLPRAGLILMIPAETPGVLREIEILVKENWLGKTLFIAPPENDAGTVGTGWDKMRIRAELRNLEIPPYCPAGFLFRLNQDGKMEQAGPLGIDVSPPPLLPPDALPNAKPEPGDEEADNADQDSNGTEGGASANQSPDPGAAAPPVGVAASTAQFAMLSLIMQSTPVFSTSQYEALTSLDGGDGGDGPDGSGAAG